MYVTDVFKTDRGKWDVHLLLFLLNVFLVVLGYSLRGSAFQVLKLSRVGLVVVSLGYLFASPGVRTYYFAGRQSWCLWVFVLLTLYVLPFSHDFLQSAGRMAAWLPFLIYLNYFIVNLFQRYDMEAARMKLLQMFNLCYIYPTVVVLSFGGALQNRDLYGQDVGGFKSNVIGWAGTLFFITAVDILSSRNLSVLMRRFLIAGIVVALIIVGTSGSRSSYLCIAVTCLILVLNNRRIGNGTKFFMALLITCLSYYMLQDENSALNRRIQKTEQQAKSGEARKKLFDAALEVMEDNPKLILTGFGYDTTIEGIQEYKKIDTKLRLHNSYLEVFAGMGIFAFGFFLVFYVLRSLIYYLWYDLRRFVFFPTLLLIPGFESNLNAGQFLFFPWMTFLFFYAHYRSAQLPLPADRQPAPIAR